MSDRRTHANPRYVTGARAARIRVPIADLHVTVGGPRDRQLVYGAPITVLGESAKGAYVRARNFDYVGFVDPAHIGPDTAPTHKVATLATHAYDGPNIKSPDTASLSFGALVTALSETETFVETALGFVPKSHLVDPNHTVSDPASIVELFYGTPYLWGGNSRLGIDCSGLIQAALHAAGFECPGDSDQQSSAVGVFQSHGSTPLRGDLLFWSGHVAMVTNPDTIVHANAHHMAVVREPLQTAMRRIPEPLTGHKRLGPLFD